MTRASREETAGADAEARVKEFIGKFDRPNQDLLRAVRRKMKQRFPTACELVYDNYNFFVIGFSPTERPSDSILSITGNANGVGLCFIQGATLPDPTGALQGSGSQTRFIRVPSADVLDQPHVQSLIAAAEAQSEARFPTAGRGTLIIRSVSAKQRPRRKSTSS